MQYVRGSYIVFADADGASRFSDVAQLLEKVSSIEKAGHGVAIGSRAHLVKTEAVVKRSFIRNLLMYGFHGLVRFLGVKDIRDTQCGFKVKERI